MPYTQEDIDLYKRMADPFFFIYKMWGLSPQPLKEDYLALVNVAELSDFKASWFEPFEKGKHITWQQFVIVLGVKRALEGKAPKRISVRAGHGIGKSMIMALLCLWYLFRFPDCQIPCTAPTSDQIHDVLWKEIEKWRSKMPKKAGDMYEVTSGYVRMRESPQTWFARAKTAKKETPEALAGIHADYVMALVDEASGVPEEVYNTAEGMLTNENILFIMISNPTRLIGYFFDSHHRDKANWQNVAFSCLDSPVVDKDYEERIRMKHGADSDEYRVRVLGEFPKADAVDDKGYVPLITADMLRFVSDNHSFGKLSKLGVDPAGEGSDDTDGVIRDRFCAKSVFKEKISTSVSIALKTATVAKLFELEGRAIIVDNFGEGANVGIELTRAGLYVNAVNVGRPAEDSERFLNIRAEAYWKAREWLMRGGNLIGDPKSWEELLSIRWRTNLAGKIQIMSKEEMRKEGIKSPNRADAFMLTFVGNELHGGAIEQPTENAEEDRFSAF